jgi:hypothetical protein
MVKFAPVREYANYLVAHLAVSVNRDGEEKRATWHARALKTLEKRAMDTATV